MSERMCIWGVGESAEDGKWELESNRTFIWVKPLHSEPWAACVERVKSTSLPQASTKRKRAEASDTSRTRCEGKRKNSPPTRHNFRTSLRAPEAFRGVPSVPAAPAHSPQARPLRVDAHPTSAAVRRRSHDSLRLVSSLVAGAFFLGKARVGPCARCGYPR